MKNSMKDKVIIIPGPTAVGKTEIAIDLALRMNGAIISADSMQIYKYMDIGSAKPTKEELEKVQHYLIDEIDPREPFSVADYKECCEKYIREIISSGKIPIITGGTGLYINSILYDMDFSEAEPDLNYRKQLMEKAKTHGNSYVHEKLRAIDMDLYHRIHPNNLKRVIRALEIYKNTGEIVQSFEESFRKKDDYDYILIGLMRNRQELYDRINHRVDILIQAGLIDEVKELLEKGLKISDISMKGIGYKEVIEYLEGSRDLEETVELIKRNTRRYAKRQMTWFRRYDDVKWCNLSDYTLKEDAINAIIELVKI